ncbi:histone deacetylase family protein [Mesorhizobium sp. M7A.F.Ca.MR.176.00.0.0]|uniref:histone deacetylase family protein n=1 Tax=unclassified Mesorhizobium TaxID=325217 RepID=UPI000FD34239|nr:histone deacetylase family protein [Mesorhizobium sp. M7A.F.Ca.MR.176.00.0.0]RUU90428.1 histone deacetylase family protein [Mesorhizobium sp. M7A.F.Ca.MR.176.00.0.0]
MKTVYSDKHRLHQPRHFLNSRFDVPNPEVPERADILLKAARAAGCEVVPPKDYGPGAREAVHDADYLKFLETSWDRWQYVDPNAVEIIPNVHAVGRGRGAYPQAVEGQAGFHLTNAACPISAHTFEAAGESANVAATAAHLVLEGERYVYALCRPPGHHASSNTASGFCYLNNSAIAAAILRSRYDRVAILDIDLHHGDGTQEIFYERGDVMTISIHADPQRFYPFFSGYASEVGHGEGEGANINIPLERGSGDDAFLRALEIAIGVIDRFSASALILAMGLDASEEDPFGGLKVTGGGFSRIGEMVGRAGLPTVLVQEGGYVYPSLGANLIRLLHGFEKTQAALGVRAI